MLIGILNMIYIYICMDVSNCLYVLKWHASTRLFRWEAIQMRSYAEILRSYSDEKLFRWEATQRFWEKGYSDEIPRSYSDEMWREGLFRWDSEKLFRRKMLRSYSDEIMRSYSDEMARERLFRWDSEKLFRWGGERRAIQMRFREAIQTNDAEKLFRWGGGRSAIQMRFREAIQMRFWEAIQMRWREEGYSDEIPRSCSDEWFWEAIQMRWCWEGLFRWDSEKLVRRDSESSYSDEILMKSGCPLHGKIKQRRNNNKHADTQNTTKWSYTYGYIYIYRERDVSIAFRQHTIQANRYRPWGLDICSGSYWCWSSPRELLAGAKRRR
jgi:hypothetical protein